MSFACVAFSFAIFSSRWAQTYSVARRASPGMSRSHPGTIGNSSPASPASTSAKPAIVTAIRFPLRRMNRPTTLSGTKVGWSCQRLASSGREVASSSTNSEASTSSGSSPQTSSRKGDRRFFGSGSAVMASSLARSAWDWLPTGIVTLEWDIS
jgi:hypothetical protein